MKNSKYTEILTDLFEKYELKDVISDDDQQFMLKKKANVFNKVMKSVKKFGMFAGIFSGLFFFFKKHSLFSIILQKIVIVMAASSLIGGTTYLVYSQIIKKYLNTPEISNEIPVPLNNNKVLKKEKIAEDIKNAKSKRTEFINYDKIKYNIRIKSFKSSALDRKMLSKMEMHLKNHFQKNDDENYAIVSNKINTSNCNHVLSLTIDEYEGEYVVNIKVIDINTSKIEMLSEMTVDSIEEFDGLWQQISKDVRAKLD